MNAISTQLKDAPATAGQTQPIVECLKLRKVFKDFWLRDRVVAVNDIDLEIRPGEVFGLLGPNGSGKSTTIKMMLGLLKPTSGLVRVFGKRPEDVAVKSRIGYLPEESYLYRFLNARETLDYYGRLFKLNGQQRRMRIDELLEMVGLEHVWRRPVGQYSKGMARKIGLAQALINDPGFLILDEPTTGMDPTATRQTKELILRLKERGKTVLLCSHLLADVEDVCDRVAIMFGGAVQRYGPIDELLTVQNRAQFAIDDVDDQTIAHIANLLEERGYVVDRAGLERKRLEALFDEVVAEATSRGSATSGARSGAGLAGFLNEDVPEAEAPARVIESLLKPVEEKVDEPSVSPEVTPAEAATQTDSTSQASQPPAQSSVLHELVDQQTDPQAVTSGEREDDEPEQKTPSDDAKKHSSVKRDVLDDLMGDKS